MQVDNNKFGRLTVLNRRAFYNPKWHTYCWECFCECNPDKKLLIAGNSIKSGRTKSCGCLRLEAIKTANYKHGQYLNHTATKLYKK